MIKVGRVHQDSDLVSEVKILGKRHSRTVGFLPDGAFEEYARKGGLLCATDETNSVVGYLLFRSVNRYSPIPKAVIAHLVVKEEFRSKGVAKQLIQGLQELTQQSHLRLELSCRQDYIENKVWPKLGFSKKRERPGRSKVGSILDVWEIELQKLPLFTYMDESQPNSQVYAVLDANVVFRMQDDFEKLSGTEKILGEEAKALRTDWLEEEVVYQKTSELEVELTRQTDEELHRRRREFASQFPTINSKSREVEQLVKSLATHLPAIRGESDSHESDAKQLAHAISGRAHFFITDDRTLLKKKTSIEETFGIRLVSPGEFVISIDEIIREQEYQPKKLAGSSTRMSLLRAEEVENLYEVLRCNETGEKLGDFLSKIRSYIAHPHIFDVTAVRDKENKILGVWVHHKKEDGDTLSVPFYRLARGNSLNPTLKRHLIQRSISASLGGGFKITEFANDCSDKETETALFELGFTRVDDSWIKLNIDYCGPHEELFDRLNTSFQAAGPKISKIAQKISSSSINDSPFSLAEIEKRLWPAKITDFPIPTFVLPIRPTWAKELFDSGLASQTFFEVRDELILKNENVYYRNPRNSGGLVAPARILWYVSSADGYFGTKSIRACSYLDEVVVDRPKALYKRFQRLGVYQWNNLKEINSGNLEAEIMALRFGRTQLFPSPVHLQSYRKILRKTDKKNPVLQSPHMISSQAFEAIYKLATDYSVVK